LLFDGTLSDWKTKPVYFQSKGENMTPWPNFPSTKNTQDTLIKEVERLCKLGVLKRQQVPKGVSPSFKVPNKNNTVCFLSNFWEVTRGWLGNPFQFSKISMVLHELKEFLYATSLHLKMGYYTI
jgi:hypothetical protein